MRLTRPRRRAFFAAAAALLGGIGPSAAAPSFFGQLEYWDKAGAFDDLEDTIDAAAATVDSATIEIRGGVGLRVGLLFPSQIERLRYGFSLGYIVGPAAEINARNASPAGTLETDINTGFVRALFEVHKGFPLTDAVEVRLRGGVGAAFCRAESDATATGFFDDGSNLDETNNWSGMTWEASPSIAFVGDKISFELGVMLAGFPKFDDEEEDFGWTPFGVRAAIGF